MLYSVEGRESERVGGGVDVENALLSGGERKWEGGRRSRRRASFICMEICHHSKLVSY